MATLLVGGYEMGLDYVVKNGRVRWTQTLRPLDKRRATLTQELDDEQMRAIVAMYTQQVVEVDAIQATLKQLDDERELKRTRDLMSVAQSLSDGIARDNATIRATLTDAGLLRETWQLDDETHDVIDVEQ